MAEIGGEEPLEIGDAIYFGCPDGQSLTGHPNAPRGFAAQFQEDGTWSPSLPDPGCIPIEYTVQGTIIDGFTNLKVAGIKVEIDMGEAGKVKATSDATGSFMLTVPGGNYTMKASGNSYILQVKTITVASDIEPDTSATIYMVRDTSDKEWVMALAYEDGEGSLDSWVKFGATSVYYGNPTGFSQEISASFVEGGNDLGLHPGTKEVSLVNVESGCQFGSFWCDVKFFVNDAAAAGNIMDSKALVKVWQGTEVAGEFKIEDCGGSEEDGWWHVMTIDAKTNKIKWNCKDGGAAAFLQENMPRYNAEFPNQMEVDFESYVGPFPGRFWRHSRRHPRKNTTRTSSFLQSHGGADAAPKRLKVGAADVDVKPMA
jgi:hypothetical protein